jgi:F-type H+-transporting ATPase subunit beta
MRPPGKPISVPVGIGTLGRIMDVLGRPIDKRGPVETAPSTLPIHREAAGLSMSRRVGQDLLVTGIKVIDLIVPVRQGRQGRPVRRRRRRQDREHARAHQQHRQAVQRLSVFAGVGERTREGNDFYHEMIESGVIDKTTCRTRRSRWCTAR